MPDGIAAVMTPMLVRITATTDPFDSAEAWAKSALSSPSATPMTSILARAGLALIAVLRGHATGATEQYSFLTPMSGTVLPIALVSADRLLGLLSQTMSNHDQAISHFEDALAFCRKAGYRPELAWSCHDYAEALLVDAHGDAPLPGDREKALSLLEESLTISRELGMLPLMERVVTLQERAASQPAKAPAYPDRLTRREVEVLQMIAAVKTDREIAEELIISVRTVGNHVSSILNKTAVANRAEAAAYATRRGLG